MTNVNTISQNNLLFPKNYNYKYFYEPKPNSEIIESLQWMGLDYSITNTINADGLNQISNYVTTKSAGTYRIITIGDSFTYGQNVNTKDNYPTQLENLLNSQFKCKNINKFEIINLGVSGYDISYTIERLKLRGLKYNPDLVLFLLINDDFYRYDEALIPLFKKFENQEKNTGEFDKLNKEGKYYYAWKKAQSLIINQTGGEDAMLKAQIKNLSKIKSVYNGPLALLTSPLLDRNVKVSLSEFTNNRNDTYFYNNLPDIYTRNEFFFPDKHPTAEGYKTIVSSIYKYITNNNVIPCQKF